MGAVDVSILIVSYNTRELTLGAIRSVCEQTRAASFEVIVVDNDSSDGSAEAIEAEFPQVKVIRRPDNPGFAAGNNIAAREASGRYVLLLNPDTEVTDGAIDRLAAFADRRADAGAWGGVCVLADGAIDPGSRQLEPTLGGKLRSLCGRDAKRVAGLQRGEDFEGEVPVLSGAFMMVRRDVWEQLGGFDESFVMYAEEADLCRRIRDSGYGIYMTGAARIRHYSGGSSGDAGRRMLQQTRGVAHYFRKHYGKLGGAAASGLIWLHAIQRLAGAAVLAMVNPGKSRELRERFGVIALRPGQWWRGWRGQTL